MCEYCGFQKLRAVVEFEIQACSPHLSVYKRMLMRELANLPDDIMAGDIDKNYNKGFNNHPLYNIKIKEIKELEMRVEKSK